MTPQGCSCRLTAGPCLRLPARPPACRYKQALKACPRCPPQVRLGIAACCLKLGNTHKAELAYNRVLELAPDCTPALLGLAVLKLHIAADEEVRWRARSPWGLGAQEAPPVGLQADRQLLSRLQVCAAIWRGTAALHDCCCFRPSHCAGRARRVAAAGAGI